MQDASTGEVLTLAYMNEEALARTRETGRDALLEPLARASCGARGETSGNTMRVRALRYDCDEDALLALVDPAGPACHTGERTCFHRGDMDPQPGEALATLERTIAERRARAGRVATSYTAALLADPPRIGEKVREEAEEVARAAAEESDERVREEAADVLYHLAVLLASRDLSLADAFEVLNEAPSLTLPAGARPARSRRRSTRCARWRASTRSCRCATPSSPTRETPVSAYLKLRGDGPSFLLESAEQGQRFGRWSFLGFRPRTVIRLEDGVLTVGGEARDADDPYAAVAEELERYRSPRSRACPRSPAARWGCSATTSCATPSPRWARATPTTWARPTGADGQRRAGGLRPPAPRGHGPRQRLRRGRRGPGATPTPSAAIAEVRERLAAPVPRAHAERREPPAFDQQHRRRGLRRGGRALQGVHPRRRRLPGGAQPALERRRAGRGVLDLPRPARDQPQPVHVLPRLRGLRDRRAPRRSRSSRSRAGAPSSARSPARARARTPPRRTSGAAEELLADEKERAEHVMLVDLARNDLGRVCEYGSVTVDELMAVETYSHVLHIVSSVSGTLREGVSAMDALRASLPAGTLSGAPKIRAMQIIDELEPVRRGPYGGAVGYLSYTGDLDTCIYIRSAVVKDGRVHVQAGGGIVADSEADYEVRETEAKARRGVRRDRAGLRAGGLGMKGSSSSTTTTRSPSTSSSTWASWAPSPRWCATTRRPVDELLERGAGARDRLARARAPPRRRACRARPSRRFAEAGTPVLGVCLGHQAHGRGLRRAGGARRAGARQDRRGRARRAHDLLRAAHAAHRGALPLAGRGPRPAARARALRRRPATP